MSNPATNDSGMIGWFPREHERLAHDRGPWLVDMICCGRDEGIQVCTTWKAADAFRETWCRPLRHEGHIDRAAIVRHSELIA